MTNPEFTLHDLKCGNIVNYMTPEGNILPCTIDWEDLKWLSEDPTGFNAVHFQMELSDWVLIKCGLDLVESEYFFSNLIVNEFHYQRIIDENYKLRLVVEYDDYYCFTELEITYLHELQNLHYALMGEHLTFNTNTN